jgi:outer membrane lipoprotein-sorting protein
MKKILFLIAMLGFIGNSFAQYDQRARNILDAMSSKYQSYSSFSAEFKYSMENKMEDIKDDFEGKVTIMGDMYRLDMGIQEIYNNGKAVWTYLPDVNEVTISEIDPEEDEDLNPTKIFTAYKTGFKYVLLDNESNADTNVIDLIPEDKDEQYFKIRMKINKQDNQVRSWVIFDKSGNNYEYQINKFEPQVSVNAGYFEFDTSKYPGVEIVDLR